MILVVPTEKAGAYTPRSFTDQTPQMPRAYAAQPQKYANHWEEDRAFYDRKAEIDEARRQRQQDPVAMAELERINSTFKAPQIDSSLPMKPPQEQGMGGTISDMLPNMQARRMMEDQRMTPPQGQSIAQQYMNPYLQAALNPQLDEARRQAGISAMKNRSRLTRSGAFGGSRQAIMDAEADRNLQQNLSNITGQGYAAAYDKAVNLFGQEEDRSRQGQLDVNKYIQNVLEAQAVGGREQRAIESEGIAADIRQFETERDFPYQQLKFQQGLLQGLPTTSYGTPYVQPSSFDSTMRNSADILDREHGGGKFAGPLHPP